MTFLKPIFLLVIVIGLYDRLSAAEFLYLAAGNTIAVKAINQSTGKLIEHQTLKLDGAGPIAFSPDKTFLYIVAKATGSKEQMSIATYKIADDAKLTFLKNAPIHMRPAYLHTDTKGNYLSGNHYREGKMSVWKLTKGVYEGEIVQELTLGNKAHSTIFSKDNKYILVPATGPNKVFQIKFDENTGKVTPNNPAFARGPKKGAREPRHLVFNRKLNIAYTTQERNNPGVATWTWDPEEGLLKIIQNIVTTKENVESITTADLHITPNNKLLYISSRDKNNERDSIIGFKIDPQSGRLSLIQHFPSEHIPRSFCISKSGKYIYVVGQGDAKLGVYKIVATNGNLEKITQYKTSNSPIWVTTLIK